MVALLYRATFTECLGSADELVWSDIEAAKQIAEANPDLNPAFQCAMGDFNLYADRIPEAVSQFLIAEQLFIDAGKKKELVDLYDSFSDAYEFINDYQKSKHYLMKSLAIEKRPPRLDRSNLLNAIGWCYYRMSEYDSSMIYLTKSIHSFRTQQPSNPEIAYPYGNLGLVYQALNQLDSAAHYSGLSYNLFERIHFPVGQGEALNNLGFVALKRGMLDSALNCFKRSYEIGKDCSEDFEKMNVVEGMIEVYTKRDPSKALALYAEFMELKLRVQGKEDALKVMQYEVAYREQKNEDKITQLEIESERKSLEIERKNMRVINTSIALVLALILAAIFYFYWYQHLRLSQSLRESNAINQRIISMISHDFRSPLNNIKLTLELLQSEDMEKAEFQTLAKDLYRQSSDVSLMFDSFVGCAISQKDGYEPSQIQFQWADAMEEVVSVSKPLADLKNVKIYVRSHSNIPVETDRMAVSLIFRNLLSNAIKYSHHDSAIQISYELDKHHVITKVKDHGIGMSEDQLKGILNAERERSRMGTDNEYGAGLGLRMVIKYVKSLLGKVTAYSKIDEGTEFIVTLPIKVNPSS